MGTKTEYTLATAGGTEGMAAATAGSSARALEKPTLATLPTELLAQILYDLPYYPDIANLLKVSRGVRQALQNHDIWRTLLRRDFPTFVELVSSDHDPQKAYLLFFLCKSLDPKYPRLIYEVSNNLPITVTVSLLEDDTKIPINGGTSLFHFLWKVNKKNPVALKWLYQQVFQFFTAQNPDKAPHTILITRWGITLQGLAVWFEQIDAVSAETINEDVGGEGSALCEAARMGMLEMVEQLIAKGADVHYERPIVKGTPLYVAAKYGHAHIVKALLDVDKNHTPESMARALVAAAADGNVDTVEALIKAGANTNYAMTHNTHGKITALHEAILNGHLNVAIMLLNNDANVNCVTTKNGSTPLFFAISGGYFDIESMLLQLGADTTIEPKDTTLLIEASRRGKLAAVKELIRRGADINLASPNGNTPLLGAIANRHDDVVAFLIENGVDVNKRGDNSKIPLHEAISLRCINIAKALIAANAAIIPSGAYRTPPLLIAALYGLLDVVDALIKANANPNETDTHFRTPLLAAIESKHQTVVDALINAGADVNIANAKGITPLFTAIRREFFDIARSLLTAGADFTEAYYSCPDDFMQMRDNFSKFFKEIENTSSFWIQVLKLFSVTNKPYFFNHIVEAILRIASTKEDNPRLLRQLTDYLPRFVPLSDDIFKAGFILADAIANKKMPDESLLSEGSKRALHHSYLKDILREHLAALTQLSAGETAAPVPTISATLTMK